MAACAELCIEPGQAHTCCFFSSSFTYKKHLEKKKKGAVFLLPRMSHNPESASKNYAIPDMCVSVRTQFWVTDPSTQGSFSPTWSFKPNDNNCPSWMDLSHGIAHTATTTFWSRIQVNEEIQASISKQGSSTFSKGKFKHFSRIFKLFLKAMVNYIFIYMYSKWLFHFYIKIKSDVAINNQKYVL